MLPLLRLVFGTSSRLSPALSARWFESLMLKPPRPPVLREPPAAIAREEERIALEQGSVAVTRWGSGPVVLLIHGWGAHAATMFDFVEPLVGSGYRVVALDLPAHGASDGVRTNVVACAQAIRAACGHAERVHGIVAHSFGGPTSAVAAHLGFRFERIALLACPASMYDLTIEFGENLGFTRRVGEIMAERLVQRLGVEWRWLQTAPPLAESGARGLVIHDRGDRTVPYHHGVENAERFPGVDFVTTDGLGHRGVTTDPVVMEKVVAFLTDRETQTATSR